MLLFDYRHCTEFLKTCPERSSPDGSGHIFNLFLRPPSAENLHLENNKTSQKCVATF
jgi:hypothetical protein